MKDSDESGKIKTESKPLQINKLLKLEKALYGFNTIPETETVIDYILNLNGFSRRKKKHIFNIWEMNNPAILQIYRASHKNHRQLNVRSVKFLHWKETSRFRSGKSASYFYRPTSVTRSGTHSGKSLIGLSELSKSSLSLESLFTGTVKQKIDHLANEVHENSFDMNEVKSFLHQLAKSMIQEIIEDSEKRLINFVDLIEQQQHQQLGMINNSTIKEINSSNLTPVQSLSRNSSFQDSCISENSAQSLVITFLNDLTDTVAIHLEDILDEILIHRTESSSTVDI